jgi:molybdopterin molybdotransferase
LPVNQVLSEVAPQRGAGLIEVDEARARIIASLPLLRTESVNLDEALGRVAARSERARMFSPPFDVSAMDGYAVRTFDVPDAGISLPLLGESRAGASPIPVLKSGTCMRLFTGAPIPAGADSVIIQENALPDNGNILFTAAAVLGQHVRTKGGSFRLNDTCLENGRTVTARDIGFIAAAGHSAIEVVRRPRIGVLSTGDELARWSRKAGPGQIHDANRPALKAAIRAWGGTPVDLGIAPDDPGAIADAVKGSASDLLVITGGASVGDYDHVRPALETIGLRLAFWKIRMRPGKPLLFGEIFGLPVLGMPGNPVSALVCALLFLRPAIAAMMGTSAELPLETARLLAPLGPTGERDDYLRARIVSRPGGLEVEPFGVQDSSMISVLAQSNGLIRRVANAPSAEAGEYVDIVRFDLCAGF